MAVRLGNDPAVTTDIARDGWTSFPSLSGLVGGPAAAGLTSETAEAHVFSLLQLDFPRQEAVCAHVSEVVRDPTVAEALKPWYPGWCKRPSFHNEYPPAFNSLNVELVDIDGKGIEWCVGTGIVFDGKQFDVDVLILGTGFEPWAAGSPAYRANVTMKGCSGVDLDEM